MIIVLRPHASDADRDHIVEKIRTMGLQAMVSQGVERTIIGVIGGEDIERMQPFEVMSGVEKVIPVLAPYKLVSREFKPADSLIKAGGTVEVGGKRLIVMAGPCAIESLERLREIAGVVKQAGATVLRGGAFKPRTSPYSFQGLGEEGLKIMQQVGAEFGMTTLTEVMDPRDLEMVSRYVDMIQIGARNMQNFNLLKEVGIARKPVLLKRGMMSSIKELLMSAEYILKEGNFDVILCERGIRTFEDFTRNTLDINAVPAIKKLSHLPVVVDPSHGTGQWGLVTPVSRAAVAAGCDGLLIEVHTHPEEAVSDGIQSLKAATFCRLMQEIRSIAIAVGREI